MNIELELNGLNCVNCAGKIEEMSSQLEGVKSSKLNFVTKKLRVDLNNENLYDETKNKITNIVNELEPDVEIIEISKDLKDTNSILEIELNGLNCTDCAAKIEEFVGKLKDVEKVEFNFITKKMKVNLKSIEKYEYVWEEINKIVNELEPGVEVLDITKVKDVIKTINLELDGLDCADCAAKIVKFTKSIKGVEDVNYDFLTSKLKVDIREDINTLDVKDEIIDIVKTLEPDVDIVDLDSIDKEKNISKKEKNKFLNIDKKQISKVVISAVLALVPRVFGIKGLPEFLLYFTSYLIIGHKVIIQAGKNIKAGVPFDENFLMTLATIAAFITSNYSEAVMVMLLYQVGEIMQGVAVNHSRDSISSLMDIRPDYANLERNGDIVVVDPSEVRIGDKIVVRPGERIPLDGMVVEGESSIDTSNITGESVPRLVSIGDDVLSGVVNLQGVLTIEVEKEFGESTVSQILDLVENASSEKAETENFITKFAKYYTPIVVFIAIGIAILPPLFKKDALWLDWMYRAAVFLVISCPCALVISVPLGFFGGLGGASKAGVLIKGGNYLEALNYVDTVVFDKTGTVTEGVFDVTDIKSYDGYTVDEILEVAAYGELYSNHPIGKSIIDKYNKDIDKSLLEDYKEIAGKGIDVKIKGEPILLGNKSLLESNDIEVREVDSIGTVVYIGKDKRHIGTIIVSDRIKDGAKEDLKKLKEVGVENTIMLSGDNSKTVKEVGDILNIDKVYGDLLPQNKVEIFESILLKKDDGSKVAFVGDGVNDAPVLARADIGIAMGGLGADAAIEAADIVIMTDDIAQISTGIKIAKNTKKIVTQNIVLALGVKLIVLILGAMGHASMWQAVFADVGVSIIAILNSIRALKIK